VSNAWREEETGERLDCLRATVCCENALEIVDGAARQDERIGFAMPDDPTTC
jgi:hypothetical protein